ncbi:MAG: hypothetical protein WBQ09_18390 [Terriglobales bacterium]
MDDLTPQERAKYRTFWAKFKTLERLQIGSLFLAFVFPLMLPRVDASVHGRWIVAVLLGIFLVTHVWLYNLDCPRCSAKFSGGLIALLLRVNYPWKCYGCDLSRRELKQASNQFF